MQYGMTLIRSRLYSMENKIANDDNNYEKVSINPGCAWKLLLLICILRIRFVKFRV